MAEFKGPLDYIDVAQRLVEFRRQYPEGSMQQVKYELLVVNNKSFIVYTAAAYRTPDDPRPGIGTAWEPVPGPTQFTRDSEMQNAETAAWGRAIVAALAGDTKKGVASAEEVRNRQMTPLQRSKQNLLDLLAAYEVDAAAFTAWKLTPQGGGVNLRVVNDPKVVDRVIADFEADPVAVREAVAEVAS
ncbi:hypothetical protein [Dietzia sp. ANT_WB102]|uniref:hypothetical protein n=1 Tax=Dietzia sp. ANT_WB102 TaxID=2597345 RepID=UPI0011EF5711|nr:hypothetical protein [Dietzia sp. ANT_WB102]KAA0916438.1 hypothetical protein FQ137_14535 [Dietzia sp. ANT_WB102]